MMSSLGQPQELGGDRYQISVSPQDALDEAVEIIVRARPDVVGRVAPRAPNATAVVAGTVAYLLDRQRPDDLPPQVDLEDVAAAYDDFPAELDAWLAGHAG